METNFKLAIISGEYKLVSVPTFEEPTNFECENLAKIFEKNKSIMLDALIKRMCHCRQQLLDAAQNNQIIGENNNAYCYKDGHFFSKIAYQEMDSAFNLIKENQWKKVINNIGMCAQLLKALIAYNTTFEERIDSRVFDFLITVLVDFSAGVRK